jgi:hypothetical protein
MALHGASLWPRAIELQGLDNFAAGVARAGALAKAMAGVPYFVTRLGDYPQTFLSGQTHEYGTTLLVLAGLFNLLALTDAMELRKAKQA